MVVKCLGEHLIYRQCSINTSYHFIKQVQNHFINIKLWLDLQIYLCVCVCKGHTCKGVRSVKMRQCPAHLEVHLEHLPTEHHIRGIPVWWCKGFCSLCL